MDDIQSTPPDTKSSLVLKQNGLKIKYLTLWSNYRLVYGLCCLMPFSTTFQSVLLVEETGVSGENH
jgi:hypothetical protein